MMGDQDIQGVFVVGSSVAKERPTPDPDKPTRYAPLDGGWGWVCVFGTYKISISLLVNTKHNNHLMLY